MNTPQRFLALAVVLTICGCTSTGSKSAKSWTKTWQKENPTWRGVHFGVGSEAQARALEEQLPRLAAVGVNVIIAEVNYGYAFESHPELRQSASAITPTMAHELARAARVQGIRLIPQFNCLGHQSWSRNTAPLLSKYPQFDETPGKYPNNTNIYCRSWCPLNPEVNQVVFALIDEIRDAFEADAFHVGMDEVFLVGSEFCPRCKGKDPGQLFAKAVNDLHAHLTKKGTGRPAVEMLMWSDRLLESKALGYSEWEAARNGTQGAIDLVPKDIIMCDWHYGKQQTYPSVPLFLQKGFRVLPSGWQPLEATKAFSAFARKQADPRMLGYLCTTWGRVRIPNAADWPPITEVLPEWRTRTSGSSPQTSAP